MKQSVKTYRSILLSLILGICLASASGQDTLVIRESDFEDHMLEISGNDSWLFKAGNQSHWANIDIPLDDWEQLAPTELNEDFMDASGNLEGWFRIVIRLDESMQDSILLMNLTNLGQAVELYVNGDHFFAFGKTGDKTIPYKRAKVNETYKVFPLSLKPGANYVIALHYRHKALGFPFDEMMEDMILQFRIKLYSGMHGVSLSKEKSYQSSFGFIAIAIMNTILLLLFILIWITNKKEPVLKLIIYSSIITALNAYVVLLGLDYFDVGLKMKLAARELQYLLLPIIIYFIVLIFSRVFRFDNKLHNLLISIPAIVMIINFFSIRIMAVSALAVVFYVGLCIYYIIRSWKHVKGAQWVLVVGFMLIIAVIIYLFAALALNLNAGGWLTYYLVFSIYPLSLLVFVALRFRDIKAERVMKAEKLLVVTEEKRLQAENQQVVLEKQVEERTTELQQSLENLKATQSQLIHAEKMASLGELTAGIAHEIQNPLNFVNNFSEVNRELIIELREELENGNLEEVKEIATDLEQNEEKISHHGKRADEIVKGMLQHSRTSSGKKEPTDINVLADEYLRLAYHGLRAKDKSFNADFKLVADENLPKVNVVPQDMGRVLLNLINNAFHAVSERNLSGFQNLTGLPQQENYKPTVTVYTKNLGDKIEIRVKDNGNGIPEEIKTKIFQPFFTTKPTGEGTGLGLSLSYDIVKAHGGEIKVNSKAGDGTEFIIILPSR
jgi:signal transduction histidine kinase